jgi:hypothetical protein
MKIRLIIEYQEHPDGSNECMLQHDVDPPMKVSAAAILGILELVKISVATE